MSEATAGETDLAQLPPRGVGGPKEAPRFRPVVRSFTKLNFSGPFRGGDEVNLQRAPSHPTRILTAITAV
jgi:hypothetical protein